MITLKNFSEFGLEKCTTNVDYKSELQMWVFKNGLQMWITSVDFKNRLQSGFQIFKRFFDVDYKYRNGFYIFLSGCNLEEGLTVHDFYTP